MDLKEFIKSVLLDIDKAVDEARAESKRDIQLSVTNEQRSIEFDVAVSVEDTKTKTGKAGVRVLEFAEAGGTISAESKNSTVSRIKFGVHIGAMTKDEEAVQNKFLEAQYARNRNSGIETY